MLHPALDRLEQDRARTTALLASGLASTFAVNRVIYEMPHRRLVLGLLREGTGLSPRRTSEPTLDSLVLGPNDRRRHYPKNVATCYLSLDSERTFLSGVSALIWIFDEREPVQTPHSAAWACAMNARLAEWCGTPVTYRDLSGEPQASPFTGPFGTFVDAELAKAADCRRSFTEELRREGLKLNPDFGAVIWSARGGAIRPGDLDISLALVWRFSRFQRWFDDTAYGAPMPEHDLAAQWQELCALAQDLRNELGPDLRLDLEDRLYRS